MFFEIKDLELHPIDFAEKFEPGAIDFASWASRVKVIDANYDGDWELPAVGFVTPPGAVLIRPDGYVAWVGDLNREGLADSLATWFGPADAA